jgi:predicted metal-dependent HD superfamily phosphohydrolase
MTNPSYNACLVEAELRARAAYAEPGRHYHGERHLDECLALLADVPDLCERERRLLRWAILWHDAVYEPGAADNEQRSAELAKRELAECGVADEDGEEVARLILLTKDHATSRDDPLGALMVSIDLAILGSDSDRYRAYADAIRQEYASVPYAEWRQGRALVLMGLLAADKLYPDPRFAALEARARRNMQGELSRLRAG